MDISREQPSVEKMPKVLLSHPRKLVLPAVVFIVIALLIAKFVFGVNPSNLKNLLNPGNNKKATQSGNTLVEQYKQQLPELRDKAQNSKDPNVIHNYAVAQYATGDIAGAETTYRKEVELNQNNAVAHNNLANALRDQGKYQDAVKEYEAAIKLAPTTMTSYINLGNMYQYQMNDKQSAIDTYKSAIKANPKAVEIYVLLGILYENDGKVDQAKDYYQQALDIQPQYPAAQAGLDRLKGKTGSSTTPTPSTTPKPTVTKTPTVTPTPTK